MWCKLVLMGWDIWGWWVDCIELIDVWFEGLGIIICYVVFVVGYVVYLDVCFEVFVWVYFYYLVSEFYICLLVMIDGVVIVLKVLGNVVLIECVLLYFFSCDFVMFWFSGQWMIEIVGGLDVGCMEMLV